jgi:hypothetical protein
MPCDPPQLISTTETTTTSTTIAASAMRIFRSTQLWSTICALPYALYAVRTQPPTL